MVGQEVSWTQMTSVADLGCLLRIPDPIFFYPGSRGPKGTGSRIRNTANDIG
jgi:hypothetical protein